MCYEAGGTSKKPALATFKPPVVCTLFLHWRLRRRQWRRPKDFNVLVRFSPLHFPDIFLFLHIFRPIRSCGEANRINKTRSGRGEESTLVGSTQPPKTWNITRKDPEFLMRNQFMAEHHIKSTLDSLDSDLTHPWDRILALQHNTATSQNLLPPFHINAHLPSRRRLC